MLASGQGDGRNTEVNLPTAQERIRESRRSGEGDFRDAQIMFAIRPAAIIACAIGALISTAALPFDNGQWNDVPDQVRSWFKSLRSPAGVHCCDVADGHRTDWEIRAGGYFIPNPADPTGEWIQVPPSAVVHNAGNPVGEAIVWWNVIAIDEDQAGIFIRCFVPGNGT